MPRRLGMSQRGRIHPSRMPQGASRCKAQGRFACLCLPASDFIACVAHAINPIASKNGRRHKMGDVCRKTGLVFFRYYKQGNVERESWITPEKFALKRRQHKKRSKKYVKNNRAKRLESARGYYYRNRELCNKRQVEWNRKNKDKVYANQRTWKKNNPERVRAMRKRQWQNLDKKKHNAKRRRYLKSRKAVDPLFKLVTNIRSMISTALAKKGYAKRSKTERILGCSFPKFKAHLEALFKEGMSWTNYGTWHIDHFIPLASASTEQEIVRLNHYTNLRPLWGEENLSKLAKMPTKEEMRRFRSIKRRL